MILVKNYAPNHANVGRFEHRKVNYLIKKPYYCILQEIEIPAKAVEILIQSPSTQLINRGLN